MPPVLSTEMTSEIPEAGIPGDGVRGAQPDPEATSGNKSQLYVKFAPNHPLSQPGFPLEPEHQLLAEG